MFSTDQYGKTAWHKAAKRDQVEELEKLWDWAKELQLETYALRYEVLFSKEWSEQTAWNMAAESHVKI